MLNEGLKSGKGFVGVDFEGQFWGIDGRGEGSIAFAPPSSLGEGSDYTWKMEPIRENIRPAPAWIIDFINGSAKRAGRASIAPALSCRLGYEAATAEQGGSRGQDGVPDLGTNGPEEACIDESSLEPRDADEAETKIADGMMKLLRNDGLDSNVRFSGKVTPRGPEGSFYSFICDGPRKCIHGHRHSGSNNFTLIKRGWTVMYRCFGTECSAKPLKELGSLGLAVSLLDANAAKLHPTHDKTMFPANRAALSETESQAHLELIKRNVTQKYRGMAAIFSGMYLIDGRIIAEGKGYQYWNGKRWIRDQAYHVQAVFSNHMARIMNWYANLREAAYKRAIHAHMRGSRTWGDVSVAPESELPEWASNPGTEGEKKVCAAARKSVNKEFPFPARGELVDLTRGSEVRTCLEFVTNSLQAPEELGALMNIVNPTLFACANGVIDIEKARLLPFHPAHMCSKASTAAYRGPPKAGARFEKFMAACFNDDQEVLDWYQLYMGHCMSALTDEQTFLIRQGEGSNGKSMLKIATSEVFGSYAVVMDADCIIEAGKPSAGAASSHIMALRAARVGESDESGERAVLNERILKAQTGGGSYTGRVLHGRQETFPITHKPILNTNYRPVLENASFSLVRRMALLPMLVTFKGPETLDPSKPRQRAKDATLERYLTSDQGREEGLSWCTEGARRYFELRRADPSRLVLEKRPRIMEDALKAYVQSSDIAARWMAECLEFEDIQPGARPTWHLALGERLGGAFRAWLKEEDLSSSLTATALKKRILLFAEGANRELEEGQFTDRNVKERGQFRGLAGVRLKPGCDYEESYN
jgi:phage/plasmid-associated DNA primase